MKRKIFFAALALLLIFSFASCKEDTTDTTPVDTETEAIPAVADTETEAPPETEAKTEVPETEPITETETEPPETEPVIVAPEFVNPLTGLPSETDLSDKRPVAIMINNIKKATPQHGVGAADILYECLAEGGITRLLMFKTEYETLGTVGSIRSSRHYYINFAADFDAIYVHAGGSPMAYEAIDDRDIDNLDGVKSNPADMFFRDSWRKKNMGYEHSLMTTGEGIAAGVKSRKYRTTIDDEYVYPFNFTEFGSTLTLDGTDATHVMLRYHKNQEVDLVYNAETGKYLRYQFCGKPHIDENDGTQLAFDNVIIVLTDLWEIKGDESGRLEVVTVGDGEGYYITGGKCVPIKWSKANEDAPISYTNEDGTPLMINRGTTFVSVFDKDHKYRIDCSDFTPDVPETTAETEEN